MKNFMNFKEFSMNENSNWDDYYGNYRETKLAKTLQDISNDIRQATRRTGDDELNPAAWLFAKGLSGLFNIGAKIADTKRGGKNSKSGTSNAEKKESKEKIKAEKEWEEFVRSSEKNGISKFGKDWSLASPRNEEERRYTEKIRKREKELIDRIIR
jgi:hypothetical protein